MSLQEVQNFLARIYTDENLRQYFLREPEKCGAENNLSDAEIVQIRQILPEQVNFFAESLVHKRLHEVGKLLPLTYKALGAKKIEISFREFIATGFLPQSIKKHLEDAIEFANYLTSKNPEPVWIKDAVKFEAARLSFNNDSSRFLVKKLDHDIRKISQAILHGKDVSQENIGKRLTFVVFLKIGGRTRQYVI